MRLETEAPQQHAPRSGLILLQVLVLGLFCLFTLRLWFLQVHKGVRFAEMARDNQLRQVLINSARGRIVDKDGSPLAVRTVLRPGPGARGLRGRGRHPGQGGRVDGRGPKCPRRDLRQRGKKRVKPFEPLILITDLTYEALARIEANSVLYPGLEIVIRQKRFYPHRAAHGPRAWLRGRGQRGGAGKLPSSPW